MTYNHMEGSYFRRFEQSESAFSSDKHGQALILKRQENPIGQKFTLRVRSIVYSDALGKNRTGLNLKTIAENLIFLKIYGIGVWFVTEISYVCTYTA